MTTDIASIPKPSIKNLQSEIHDLHYLIHLSISFQLNRSGESTPAPV